jgi:osmotically-inducible protein OsmY
LLSGTVATAGERLETERAARRVDGVERVANLVVVQAQEWTEHAFLGPAAAYGRDGESGSVAGRIEALFERDAEIDGTGIGIAAQGGRVVLTGTVRSWRERDLAERVAWSTPGVTEVEDRMIVLRNTAP